MTSFAMRTSSIDSKSVCGKVFDLTSSRRPHNCSVTGFRKTVLAQGSTLLSLPLCKIPAFGPILPDSMKILTTTSSVACFSCLLKDCQMKDFLKSLSLLVGSIFPKDLWSFYDFAHAIVKLCNLC